VGGLQTEDPLVPERIMGEANILDLEFSCRAFHSFAQARWASLSCWRSLETSIWYGIGKIILGMAIRLHGQIIANRDDVRLVVGNGRGKTGRSPVSAMLKALLPLERW
jgi:hypothetical protein